MVTAGWALHTAPAFLASRLASGQGLLVAAVDGSSKSATLVGAVPVPGGDWDAAAARVSSLLPQGLQLVGTYSSSGSAPSWQPTAGAGSVPAVTASDAAGAVAWAVNGQAAAAPAAAAAANGADGDDPSLSSIAPGFVPLRCHLEVQLNVQHAATAANGNAAGVDGGSSPPSAAAVEAAVQQLAGELLTQQLAFVTEPDASADAPGTPLILSSTSASSSSSSVHQALGGVSGSPCVSLLLLQGSGSGSSIGGAKPAAPMFEFEPAKQRQQQLARVLLSLDVLAFAPAGMQLSAVAGQLLLPALRAQLAAAQALLLSQLAERQALPTALAGRHFVPPGLGFALTVLYPQLHASAETSELKLLPLRQQLHALLGLPDNVPMLRDANALAWAAAQGGDAGAGGAARTVRLRNVHEGLAPPAFGGQLYLVDGHYEYAHYMQDKFNDAGWGCAYRSLQTLVSWFRLQKYTAKPVPGHRQIQELLVALGDKDASFVGSSKWIGAVELGYILDEYCGITVKVLPINKGADIPSHARQLAQHFATQGTPVMIGGGVLAYTLLGVAFNEDTGEAAFLILDPHYTGGEDIRSIHQGSWVAWKQLGDNAAAGGPLFVKDAFYNFLCPQRPRTV